MLTAPSAYAGTRPSRKLRTSRVEVTWMSPGPRAIVGFTQTSGRPRAASLIASASRSCTEFTYGMPSPPAVNSCVSSAVAPRAAGPSAVAPDVSTTRSTSARRHSWRTVRALPTLTSNTRSASSGRTEVIPAA